MILHNISNQHYKITIKETLKILKTLCNKLGKTSLVEEFEVDFVSKELVNDKAIALVR